MKIRNFLSSEIFLFCAVFLIILLHFGGLFHATELPGWDTDAHFVALSKMATEFLPNGSIQGYMPEWFGGIPLFQFYAPLYFILVAGAWLISGKIIPLVLLFRVSLFFSIFLISVSLWFFTKTAFGKNAGKWSIFLSLFAIFYPISDAQNGIGAGSIIASGLITGSIGFSLLLIQFAFLLRLSKNPGSKTDFLLYIILLSVIALTHTLSFVGSIFGIIFFLLYFHKNGDFLRVCGVGAAIGIGLASFWMVPFFSHLELSSSSVVLMQGDPLIAMFPFNPRLLLNIATIPYFNFWALGFFFLTLFGIHTLLFKKNERVIPFLFFLFFVFVVRNFIPTIVPSVALHFYRFSPILFFLSISLSAFALDFIQKNFIKTNKQNMILIVLCAALFLHSQTTFSREANSLNSQNAGTYYSKIPINWNFDTSPYYAEGKEVLSRLAKKTDAQKILVIVPADILAGYLGSPHYFDSMIPMKNGQNNILGLYAESSPLTPFIMPTIRALGENKVLSWGETQLSLSSDFINQPYETHLGRIFDIGVNYIVSFDLSVTAKLLKSEMVTLDDSTGHFFIFKAKKSSPTVFAPQVLPFAYIQGEKGIKFREIGKAVYAGKTTYSIPLLNLEGVTIEKFSHEADTASFSGLVFSGEKIDGATLSRLEKFNIPVIVISKSVRDEDIALHPTLHFITTFESLGKDIMLYRNPAYGWRLLHDKLETLSIKNETSTPILVSFSPKKIIIETDSKFSILNIGYSPYWKINNCAACRLFEISPARIAVEGKGIIEIVYDTADTAARVGYYISITSLVLLMGIWYFWKRK